MLSGQLVSNFQPRPKTCPGISHRTGGAPGSQPQGPGGTDRKRERGTCRGEGSMLARNCGKAPNVNRIHQNDSSLPTPMVLQPTRDHKLSALGGISTHSNERDAGETLDQGLLLFNSGATDRGYTRENLPLSRRVTLTQVGACVGALDDGVFAGVVQY